MSVGRRRLQTFWPGEDDIVPLASAARIGHNGERMIGGAVPARIARPPRLTAADFTPERMLRSKARPPADGWRRAVYVATRGVAIDANPDAGTLGYRLRRDSGETIATLLHNRAVLASYADVRAYGTQAASRLEVIAGDDRPDADARERDSVREAVRVLERHYNLVCLDTPAGVLSPTAQGVLDAADQLVIVSPTGLDGARAASSTLDWLEEHAHATLASSAVVALNGVRAERGDVDVDRIEAHFASRCRACVRVPWDPHLESGAHVSLEDLRPTTREALLELAAAIAFGFTETAARRS